MDTQLWKATIEAQWLMGHCGPSAHLAADRASIVNWSWDVDVVRQQLNVPLTEIWRIFPPVLSKLLLITL
jgi:hypothetical protein